MNNDDFDIKIFSPTKKIEDAEPIVIADEMKRQVISGNLQKAKFLGIAIAKSFREAADKEELWTMAGQCGVSNLDRKIKNQAIILSVFTAEYCLDRYIPSILSTTATSMLYDTLIEDASTLYNELLASAAFSFYYMNMQNNEVTSEDVGRTFAMLCGDKTSESLNCYGINVFESSTAKYKKAIDEVDFSE